jgi:hypothetical protein
MNCHSPANTNKLRYTNHVYITDAALKHRIAKKLIFYAVEAYTSNNSNISIYAAHVCLWQCVPERRNRAAGLPLRVRPECFNRFGPNVRGRKKIAPMLSDRAATFLSFNETVSTEVVIYLSQINWCTDLLMASMIYYFLILSFFQACGSLSFILGLFCSLYFFNYVPFHLMFFPNNNIYVYEFAIAYNSHHISTLKIFNIFMKFGTKITEFDEISTP